MLIPELVARVKFSLNSDRIGPDLPFSHWMLHFPSLAKRFCKRKFARFDSSASFRPGAYAIACSKITLGKGVVIRPGTMLFADPAEGGAGIDIEDYVLIGSGVHMYTGNHRYMDPGKPIYFQGHEPSASIVLKNGCWIGANAVILPGVTIGQNSVVGAGSIVTKSIPPFSVAVGNPAKVIRQIKP